MKLKDFDFRIWDNIEKKYLNRYPTIIKDNEDGILIGRSSRFYSNTADMFIENTNRDFEIELWTGYLDKNGKKIYEGDILENKMTMEDLPYKVVFKWGAFYLVEIDGNDEDLMSEFLFMELEVIGNIHENAELLKC